MQEYSMFSAGLYTCILLETRHLYPSEGPNTQLHSSRGSRRDREWRWIKRKYDFVGRRRKEVGRMK